MIDKQEVTTAKPSRFVQPRAFWFKPQSQWTEEDYKQAARDQIEQLRITRFIADAGFIADSPRL